MKCIQYLSNGNIVRIMDESARSQVDNGKAKYVSKETWKEQVRDIGKEKK